MSPLRTFFNFLVPGFLLFASGLFLINSPYLQKVTSFQIDFATAIVAALSILLALRFDRSRLIILLQLLIYADIAERLLAGTAQGSARITITSIIVLNLVLVSLLKERGVKSLRGLIVTAFPLLQMLAFSFWPGVPESLVFPQQLSLSIIELPALLSTIPNTLLLLMVVALSIQLVRFLRYPTPLEGAVFWAIVSVATTLLLTPGIAATALRGSAVLALFIATIEMSHTLAYRDELTGLPGRRALMETFSKLGGRYSIAMVDIDFFKKLNDKYGHDVGDQVLKMVATRLAGCSGGGRAFRYGGEEFCVVFSGKSEEACEAHLEDLRSRIADLPFTVRKLARPLNKPKNKSRKQSNHNSIPVTVSIGIAEKTGRYNHPEAVMKQADQALYKAKHAGRNRVCTATSRKKG